ncbi:MAG: class II aldolase/adducin family protein [Deltaproteobacteria bacterium]|nr:class II aldolase/adducin family protein [Deltaproteobacteria bacterium]
MARPPSTSLHARPSEGVVLFEAEHRQEALDATLVEPYARPLLHWRQRLFEAAVIGQDPGRYEGAGFGNVSVRLPARGDARPFLVTGTQTGGRESLSLQDLCVVESWDLSRNRVVSRGLTRPSSESMTHGALYDRGRDVRFIFHGHAPALWRAAAKLRLPTTHPDAGYGTPEMAREVVVQLRAHPGARVLAMGGHEDGIIAFGASAHEAGTHLLKLLRELEQK